MTTEDETENPEPTALEKVDRAGAADEKITLAEMAQVCFDEHQRIVSFQKQCAEVYKNYVPGPRELRRAEIFKRMGHMADMAAHGMLVKGSSYKPPGKSTGYGSR